MKYLAIALVFIASGSCLSQERSKGFIGGPIANKNFTQLTKAGWHYKTPTLDAFMSAKMIDALGITDKQIEAFETIKSDRKSLLNISAGAGLKSITDLNHIDPEKFRDIADDIREAAKENALAAETKAVSVLDEDQLKRFNQIKALAAMMSGSSSFLRRGPKVGASLEESEGISAALSAVELEMKERRLVQKYYDFREVVAKTVGKSRSDELLGEPYGNLAELIEKYGKPKKNVNARR